MNTPHYAEHERLRHAARVAWGLAILDDIEARVRASSDPDTVVALDIGDAIFAWELDEGAEEIRLAIGGPLSWDDTPGADEQPPPALAAIAEARDNLERRATFYASDENVPPAAQRDYRLDSSETFLRRAISTVRAMTRRPPTDHERPILVALANALERSLADGGQ